MTDLSGNPAVPASTSELIALGRDREAVVAATRDAAFGDRPKPHNQGVPMDGVQQLDEILPLLEDLVEQLAPEDLTRSTACAKLDVAGVLEHMIAGATVFAPAFRGDAPSAGEPDAAGTVEERWGRAIAELADAVHAPGAQERTIASPFGAVPGSMFARYVALDGLVHGWDLATATGLSYSPPEAVVEEVATFARELLQPEMRDGDTFAQETTAPPGADALERLVAFTGREVPAKERV